MATRTQKAAMKKKAEKAANEAAKEAEAQPKAATKRTKAPKKPSKKPSKKPTKAAKASRKKSPEPQPGEHVLDFKDETPGFFARLRQRRAERAEAHRLEAERLAAERARAAEEEARLAEERRVAEEREAEEARKRAEVEAEAAAKAQKAERQKAARAEAAARRKAEKEAAAEEERLKAEAKEKAKELRRLEREAERARLEEREQRLAEEQERLDSEQAAKEAKALARAEPVSEAEVQADRVAAELARRRSKPVVVEMDDGPAPSLSGITGRKAAPVAAPEEAALEEKASATRAPPPSEGIGFSLPEAFLLLANEGGWDERTERNAPGALGAALAGSLLLDLVARGRVLIQRDRFTIVGDLGDDATEAVVAKLQQLQAKRDRPSLPAHVELAKWNRELLAPFKERLARRGLITHGHRMHLGLFYRCWVEVVDVTAPERLRNRLRRTIAGGGTPEAESVLLLGLMDACGLLESIVPAQALDYNRKRLNGLLAGRDIMGYKVDPRLKGVQEVAVRTILQNVRQLSTQG
jgi:multidrug efflux pump subunit AcrA (membrane-fusion protein)